MFCALRDLALEEKKASGADLLGAIQGGSPSQPRPWLRLRASDEAFFQTHVRAPRHGFRWAAIGALVTLLVLMRLHAGGEL